MKKTLYLLLYSLLFLFFTYNSTSQISILKADADSLVLVGSDYIYNVQFDSARTTFEEMIKRYPKHPAGYFLDAMIDWWRITIHRNNTAFEGEFLKNINKVLKVCNNILDENPKDITALFFKGGALGYRGRYYAINENWFDAASDGKEAFDIMQTCHKEAPGNHDIMLGSGIYNYFAAVLPEEFPLAKPLLTFLPPADRKIGLYQLKAAALDSRYSKVEAMVVLLQAYYSFEKDYRIAHYWSEILFKKYPNNPYFHRYYARCLNKTGNWDSLEVEWRELVKRSIARMEGYNNLTALEGLYFIGLALQRKGKHNDAIKYFLKTIEVAEFIGDFDNGFKVSALYKLAYSYERTNDIKKAKEYYNKCLEFKDNSNYESAKEKLKRLK